MLAGRIVAAAVVVVAKAGILIGGIGVLVGIRLLAVLIGIGLGILLSLLESLVDIDILPWRLFNVNLVGLVLRGRDILWVSLPAPPAKIDQEDD